MSGESQDQQRVHRPRAAWEGRLDAIDDRLDGLVRQLSQVIGQVGELQDQAEPQADLSHDLKMLSDRVADTSLDSAVNREVLQRLEGMVGTLGDSVHGLDSAVEAVRGMVEGLRATLLSRDTSSEAITSAVDRVAEQLRAVDRRMVSRADIDEVRQRIEQAEVALAHQANIIGEALRSRVDDQRVLSNELGAQLANLTASVSDSVDLPDKVRREIHKEVEELAEHLGVAMRDLRTEMSVIGPRELPTVTGLDRLSGRIHADNERLTQAVTSAQATSEERLRRLDAQVSDLRQRLELLRLNQPLGSKRRRDPDGSSP